MQRATEDNPQPDVPEKAKGQWRSSVGQRGSRLRCYSPCPAYLSGLVAGGHLRHTAGDALSTYELHKMMLHAGYHPHDCW